MNDIGQRLAKHSHRSELVWHFTLLDSPEINAFALPGGYVYVTRGIMAYLESEADLAGVIGHEIGHVTARHGAQRATKQQAAGLGVVAATVLGAVLEAGGVGGATQAVGGLAQNVAVGLIAKYGREQELQADGLGAEYLSRSNYDPKNMVDVIEVLKNQERFAEDAAKAKGRAAAPKASWLASHPSNDQRLQEIRQIAARYQGQYNDEGRARYLQAINGMAFGESRAQGVTRGRNFYHEPLGIALTAPAGWQIQNSPNAIAVINEAGDAGVIVNIVPAKAGNTHAEIIRNTLQARAGAHRDDRLEWLACDAFHGDTAHPAGPGGGRGSNRRDRPIEPELPDALRRERRADLAAQPARTARGGGNVSRLEFSRPQRGATLGGEDGTLPQRQFCGARQAVATARPARAAAAAAQRRLRRR